jgi:hypothetical protein
MTSYDNVLPTLEACKAERERLFAEGTRLDYIVRQVADGFHMIGSPVNCRNCPKGDK